MIQAGGGGTGSGLKAVCGVVGQVGGRKGENVGGRGEGMRRLKHVQWECGGMWGRRVSELTAQAAVAEAI